MSKWRTSMGTTRDNNVYHTDKECRAIGDNIKEVTDSEVDYYDLRQCKFCKSGGSVSEKKGGKHESYHKLMNASPDDLDEL